MALLHRSKLLLAFVLLALLVTVAPDRIEAQEGSEFQLRVRKSADVSNDSVEIIISTDRQLREVPKVYVTRVIDEEGTAPVFITNGSGETVPIDGARGPVRHTGFNFYKYVHSSPDSGLYSVYVEAEDYLGARAKAGSPHSSADATAFTFELDMALNGGEDPELEFHGPISSSGDSEIPEFEAYGWIVVTVDFSKESGEYPGDSFRTVTLTSAEQEVEFGDGTKETINVDLRFDIATPDNIRYRIPLWSPRVGSYSLTLRVSDAAGNTSGTEGHVVRWNVVPIKPLIIDLAPGWNLVSFPFHFGNPAINSVMRPDHPADIVMTFDNETRVWEVSRRDPETGRFTGDIIVMTAYRAYFIRTDSFQGLRIEVVTYAGIPYLRVRERLARLSFPFRKWSPALNIAKPAAHPADIVMTLDNENRVWHASRRDGNAWPLTGENLTMAAFWDYYTRSEGNRSQLLYGYELGVEATAPPPPLIVMVQAGWNLVPVLTDGIPLPETVSADDYFGSLGDNGWLKALTFNTLDQTWESVSPGETVPDGDDEDSEPDPATLTVGKGYWLYATKDGVIIKY